MYRPITIPNPSHLFFGPRQSWNFRLGDVRYEISADDLAKSLRIFIDDFHREAKSKFVARIDACLKVRDEAVAAAAQATHWPGMTAGVMAEEQARSCLSAIRSEIEVALIPAPQPGGFERKDVTAGTAEPSVAPNIVVPVAVGAAVIAAVFLFS